MITTLIIWTVALAIWSAVLAYTSRHPKKEVVADRTDGTRVSLRYKRLSEGVEVAGEEATINKMLTNFQYRIGAKILNLYKDNIKRSVITHKGREYQAWDLAFIVKEDKIWIENVNLKTGSKNL